MLDLLKKAFWVPYEDGSVYPTVSKARQAIAPLLRGERLDLYLPQR